MVTDYDPDIILRDPLDMTQVQDRRVARKFYEQELKQKMEEKKRKAQEERDKKIKELAHK